MSLNNIMYKKKRAISPILSVLLILTLVIIGSSIVGILLLNVDIVDLQGSNSVDVPSIILTIEDDYGLVLYDENLVLYDQINFKLSLSSDTTIYIYDIDVLLPTGKILDTITPWSVKPKDENQQVWNEYYGGYTLKDTLVPVEFFGKCEDPTKEKGLIGEGQSFYLLVHYIYSEYDSEDNVLRKKMGTAQSGLWVA